MPRRPRYVAPAASQRPADALQADAPCAFTLAEYPEVMTPEEVAAAVRISKREVLEHPDLGRFRLALGKKSPRWSKPHIIAWLCAMLPPPPAEVARYLVRAAQAMPGPLAFAIPRLLRVRPGTLYEGRRLPTDAAELEALLLHLLERAEAEPVGR